jgi:voltage-gated potassium channel
VASAKRPPASLGELFRPFGRRFAWAAAYFALLFLGGAAGYVLIEGWSFFDGLYMAVTTVTSVGFMEVHPLSPPGRVFTMVLLLLGITGLGVWWGLITALIVEADLGGLLRRRRMRRKVQALEGHFIVCGAGRVGMVVAEEMHRSGTPFVVVEREHDRASRLLEDDPEALLVEGDATREQTLEAAGIRAARGLAACLAEDADNLLLCMTARGLKADLTIVARAYDEGSLAKLRRAGADHAISPNVTGGIRMAAALLRPSVVSFLDVATTAADLSLWVEEVAIADGSPLAGRSLSEARIPQRTGLVVIALRHGGEARPFTFNPGPETRVDAGDVMIVLGRREQISVLREVVGGRG